MLIQADARRIPLADQSVQCVVTSPPYWGLRDYGITGQLGLEKTPAEYVANMVAVFREVRRVLRDDGVLWLNLGDSYAAGGHGGGGSYMQERKDAAWQHRNDKTGWKTAPPGLKPKDLVGIPWRVAFALQEDGWYLRSDVIWSKPNPMPESVRDRPTKAHEYVFLLTKQSRYYWDADAVRESYSPASVQRSKYALQDIRTGTAGKRECHGLRDAPTRDYPEMNELGRNIRTVWEIATQPYSGAHYAVMPEKLVERCVLAASKTGDTVFDPFVGSGTVVKVARNFGRVGVGLDLNAEYLGKQAQQRIKTQAGLPL